MTAIQFGILGLAGAIAATIWQKKSFVEGLQFGIAKIGFTANSQGIVLLLYVTAANTRNITVRINAVDLAMQYNDQDAGTIRTDLQIIAEANRTVTIPLAVTIPGQVLADTIYAVATGSLKGPHTFKVSGTVTLDGIPFPVSMKYTIA